MAAELPRPGVEVIQEFTTAVPTVIQPTLVPFVTGPAKEIVEFTDSDGLLNTGAKQGSYAQLPLTLSQSAFPSPRGNIQEVNVEEATIKAALLFGGTLSQLDRSPGSAFLTAHNEARRAAIRTVEIPGGGIALDGLVAVFAIDQEARLNTLEDVTVTFAGSGNLTAQQVADQINAAVGSTVATLITFGASDRVQIASLTWGAASSVTLRAGGSANELLGAITGLDNAVEYRVEGAGFHGQDQADNTTLSPWIVFSRGLYLEDGVSTSFLVAQPTTELDFGQITVDADSVDVFAAAVAPAITFAGGGSIALEIGDYYFADGVRPNSTAEVARVETARFKLGIINTTLSTFDSDGNVLTAVRDDFNINTLLAGVAFSPRYGWFRARGITEDNAAATAGVLTGGIGGAPATVALILGTALPGGPHALAGLTLITTVTLDGVEQAENTFTFTGGPFADLAAILTAIGATIPNVVATDVSGELQLATSATGADQTLVLSASSSALVGVGIAAGTATGTDVEFVDIAAVVIGGTQTFPFDESTGETFIIEESDDGGVTWTALTRTFTMTTSTSAFATAVLLVAELNTGAKWDGGTLPTTFTIAAVGDTIVLTSTALGSLVGLRVATASTAIGAVTDEDLLFTGDQSDIGEENLVGLIFKYRLNDRPQIYSTTFLTDSLDDAVAEVNATVGFTIASIGGGLLDRMILTSPLVGAASRIEVVDDGVNNFARSALGFTGGNVDDSGSGRPNADFQVDNSGNALIGAEILRSSVTGDPFATSLADLYIQYTALRLDVSPLAVTPGLLSLSDVTTLQTVLNPINSNNPLGLAMFFQIINAPGIASKGMGVSATSAAAPEGTLLAYTEVADFIESEEVYCVAPLTHDETVFQMFRTHIDFMSGAQQKGERVLFQTFVDPVRRLSTVVVSGLSSDTTATQNELVIDVNPSQGLIDNNVNPADPIPLSDDVYVEVAVAGILRRYNVSNVNSTLITFRTTFATGENADAFYTTTPLTETLVNADWSMQIRGTLLTLPGSSLPDKDAIAATVAAANAAIKNRRIYSTFPDTVVAAVSGLDEALPTYYYNSALTGLTAAQPPQQGFTNLSVTGFTGVQGSQDTFSTRQLNIMAGGGTWVIVQDASGAPVISRHQISTDLTSIETREYSITKVIDFVAKFMRTGLRNFIGTFNITQTFLDTLSTVIQGMLQFLEEGGVILGGDLNNLIQDKANPDTVLVDVTLDVPFPANYIRLTLVV